MYTNVLKYSIIVHVRMLGFATYCPTCGIDVEKEKGIKRFGKYFCSEQHAADYTKMRMMNEEREEEDYSRSRRGFGGCCG